MLLEKLQISLSGQVVDLYYVMAADLDINQKSFESHFKELGYWMYKIQKYDTLKSLTTALYNLEFEELGYYDEDSVDVFLEIVLGR